MSSKLPMAPTLSLGQADVKNFEILFQEALGYFFPSATDEGILSGLMILESLRAAIRIRRLLTEPTKSLESDGKAPEKFEVTVGRSSQHSEPPLNLDEAKEIVKGPLGSLTDALIKLKSPVVSRERMERQDSAKSTSLEFPEHLRLVPKPPRRPSLLHLYSELIYSLQPLVYCYAMKINGIKSWKPYFISLAVDLLWIFLRVLAKGRSALRKSHIRARISTAVYNYLFRDPFFGSIFRDKLLQPVLLRVLGDGTIFGWVMRLLEFKSTLAHTI